MKKRNLGCWRIGLWGLLILAGLCLAAVGLAAWDNTRLPVRSAVTEVLPPVEKARLVEAQHLRRVVGDEVLPGWGQVEIPVILYNEDYVFLTGYRGVPPDGWASVPQGTRRGSAWEVVPGDDLAGEVYYRQELVSSQAVPQAFTVQVGEGYAASLTSLEFMRIGLREQVRRELPEFLRALFPYRLAGNLLVDSSDQYISLVLHEAAHAYQGLAAPGRLAAGEQANLMWSAAYPWQNEALIDAWQAELDLLARALRAASGEETRSLALEFIQQRQARRQSVGLRADLVEYERQREWVEGIARYAEISVYRLAAQAGYSPLEGMRADPEFRQYRGFNTRWSSEIDQMRRMADDEGDGRFYYSGMAQAVLLDRLAPGWKDRLFEPEVWLDELLVRAVGE